MHPHARVPAWERLGSELVFWQRELFPSKPLQLRTVAASGYLKTTAGPCALNTAEAHGRSKGMQHKSPNRALELLAISTVVSTIQAPTAWRFAGEQFGATGMSAGGQDSTLRPALYSERSQKRGEGTMGL